MHRRTAAAAGALFITATAAGAAGAALLGAGAEDRRSVTLGALLITVMAVAIAMIPAALYPVLSGRSPALAVGYAVSRTVEAVAVLPTVVTSMLLVSLREAHGDDLGRSETLLTGAEVPTLAVSTVFFCLSAALLNSVLFSGRLVPRWISGWALAAVAPYLAAGLLVMFDRIDLSSPLYTALVAPLALNELVLAVRLLTKGFAPLPQAAAAAPAMTT